MKSKRQRRQACTVCGKLVDLYAPKHGPTGNHWECRWSPEMEDAYKQLRAEFYNDTRPVATGEVAHAWANGGSLVHLVDLGDDVALCGHKPKRNAKHMKQRGRWMFVDPAKLTARHDKRCPKCEAVFLKGEKNGNHLSCRRPDGQCVVGAG